MWKLNTKKALLDLKRTKSANREFEIPHKQTDGNQAPTYSLAQLAARGDLDLNKEKTTKENVMKSFDFDDENMIDDVLNTEKYLLN